MKNEKHFELLEKILAGIDNLNAVMTRHMAKTDAGFKTVDERFKTIDKRSDENDKQHRRTQERIDRLEMKLDHHIQNTAIH